MSNIVWQILGLLFLVALVAVHAGRAIQAAMLGWTADVLGHIVLATFCAVFIEPVVREIARSRKR